MNDDRRDTPPERPSAKTRLPAEPIVIRPAPPRLPVAGPGVGGHSFTTVPADGPRRLIAAAFTIALVVFGFFAICAHAERMAVERDRCLDQLHGKTRGR